MLRSIPPCFAKSRADDGRQRLESLQALITRMQAVADEERVALQQAHEQIGTLLSQQSDAYKALQAQLGRQSQAEARAHDAIATLSEQYARLESVPSEPNVGAVLRALQAALPALQAWAGTAASDSAGACERMAVAASGARHSRPNPA